MKHVIIALGLCVTLAACGGFNGREDAMYDARFRHPIAVDPQVVTLRSMPPGIKLPCPLRTKPLLALLRTLINLAGMGC